MLRLTILQTKGPTADQSRLDQIRSDRNGIRSEIYTPVLTSDWFALVNFRAKVVYFHHYGERFEIYLYEFSKESLIINIPINIKCFVCKVQMWLD